MKRILYSLILLALANSCGTPENTDVQSGIIAVDLQKEYPQMNLRLSDLADISYIQLGGKDSVNFLTDTDEISGNICMDKGLLIIGDCIPEDKLKESKCNNEIYLFDTSGHFVRSLGEGNKKALSLFTSFKNMRVFPSINKIAVHHLVGDNSITVYDYMGNTLNEYHADKAYFMSAVLGNKLAMYDHLSVYIKSGKKVDKGRTLNVIDIETGEECLANDIKHKNILDTDIMEAGYALHSTGENIYITSSRTDTVYSLDKNLNITPKFVSVNHNKNTPETHNIIFPIVETPEYILFCNNMDYQSQKEKKFKSGNWIYLKSEQKTYLLSDMGYMDYNSTRDGKTYTKHLLADKIFLNQRFCTQRG